MPVLEAQRRAHIRWVEKNWQRLVEYKAQYWQKNEHKYLKPRDGGDTNVESGASVPENKCVLN
jgi:hypothetical protein